MFHHGGLVRYRAASEGTMSRDARPRRRQESWEEADPRDAKRLPGADVDSSSRDAWHVSPSRLRHGAPAAPKDERRTIEPTLFDQVDEEPERWDGMS
jgi:hypothetical protein